VHQLGQLEFDPNATLKKHGISEFAEAVARITIACAAP